MRTNKLAINIVILSCLYYCQAARLCPSRCNKYYYDPYQEGSHLSEDEEMCALSKATLRTILRGLVAVLTRVFPECALPDCPNLHQEQLKREEPVKIFRQIMACPSLPVPYYHPSSTCCTPPTQIPPPPTIPSTYMHTQV